jgi:hypothetical protein
VLYVLSPLFGVETFWVHCGVLLIKETHRRLQKNKFWDNPVKQKQFKKLLGSDRSSSIRGIIIYVIQVDID